MEMNIERRILEFLQGKDKSSSAPIATELGVDRKIVDQHLRSLLQQGKVSNSEGDKVMYWSLCSVTVEDTTAT